MLITHSWHDYASLWIARLGPAGWIGVDLFFVLSGFLITGILVDSVGSEHYFRNFYIRRGLRIWPLYLAMLVFVFLAVPHLPRLGLVEDFPHSVFSPWYYIFYLQNFAFGTDGPFPLAVTWSLAIEEHFYLFWPLVVVMVPRKHLLKVLVGFILLVSVGRYWGLHYFGNSHNSFFRFDEMAWGALVAVWMRAPSFSAVWLKRLSLAGCWLIIPTVYWITVQDSWSFLRSHGIVYILLSISFTSWLGLALTATQESWLFRFLNLGFLRHIGKISYGIYLFHPFILPNYLLHRAIDQIGGCGWAHQWLVLLVTFGATILAASLSWRIFESPILKLKARFEAPSVTTAALTIAPESEQVAIQPA